MLTKLEKVVTVRLPMATHKALAFKAQAKGVTVSQILRSIIVNVV